jgi:Flp pilus assembly protein TadD
MVSALANLGNAYFSQEKYDAAIEQYRRAIQVKPDDSGLRYNLGAAHSNKGEYQQAIIEYRKAVELKPEMGDAHNGLAFAYYKLEKYDLAAEHIGIAEELGAEISAELLAAIEGELR